MHLVYPPSYICLPSIFGPNFYQYDAVLLLIWYCCTTVFPHIRVHDGLTQFVTVCLSVWHQSSTYSNRSNKTPSLAQQNTECRKQSRSDMWWSDDNLHDKIGSNPEMILQIDRRDNNLHGGQKHPILGTACTIITYVICCNPYTEVIRHIISPAAFVVGLFLIVRFFFLRSLTHLVTWQVCTPPTSTCAFS